MLRRHKLRASSFTSCLLFVVLVFGGIGFYYFKYFQWRFFEKPLDGLVYVKTDGAPLNDFRRKAVSDLIDPTKQVLDRIKKMRKETNKGTETYPEFEQHCKEIRNRLLEIMRDARSRRIPNQFKPKYDEAILALKDAYECINYFEDSMSAETPGEHDALYEKSFKAWKDAKRKADATREHFGGDDWTRDVDTTREKKK